MLLCSPPFPHSHVVHAQERLLNEDPVRTKASGITGSDAGGGTSLAGGDGVLKMGGFHYTTPGGPPVQLRRDEDPFLPLQCSSPVHNDFNTLGRPFVTYLHNAGLSCPPVVRLGLRNSLKLVVVAWQPGSTERSKQNGRRSSALGRDKRQNNPIDFLFIIRGRGRERGRGRGQHLLRHTCE